MGWGEVRGKLSAAGRPGTKKRGDKDLTAVGAAGWSLRGLNLSADGEGRVGELCALLPTECVPLQTNTHTHARTHADKHFHFQAARWFHSNTSRTPSSLEKRRQSSSYLCATSVRQRNSVLVLLVFAFVFVFLDYWNHEPQARYHGFMDQVGVVLLLLLGSKRGLSRQVRTRSTLVELRRGCG